MHLTIGIYVMFCISRVFVDASGDISLSSLVARIEELEKRDQRIVQIVDRLQDENTQQNHIIKDQSTKINRLEDENSRQSQVIADLLRELESVKKVVEEPNNELAFEASETERPSNEQGLRRNELSRIHSKQARRYLLNGAGNGADTVAFHALFATHTHVEHQALGTPIAFPDVMLNVGGGYHNSTSLFIAPIPGIYIFSASVMSSLDTSHGVHAGIMKNGAHLGGIYAGAIQWGGGNDPEQGSVTLVTQLQAGDEVWVEHIYHDDGRIFGGGLTSFMGSLITPL